MKFSECQNLAEFKNFFKELQLSDLKNLSMYETVVAVIYDSHSYTHMYQFIALYRELGFINKMEADEIEQQFMIYVELAFS